MTSNFALVLWRMLESFSWDIIHDILQVAALTETLGSFQSLAMVSLAPRRMKCISLRVCFGVLGKFALRRAMDGIFRI